MCDLKFYVTQHISQSRYSLTSDSVYLLVAKEHSPVILMLITALVCIMAKVFTSRFYINITSLRLEHTFCRFTTCYIVFSYFIKLVTMFAFLKTPPVTHSNEKQNVQFQIKLICNNAEVNSVYDNTL